MTIWLRNNVQTLPRNIKQERSIEAESFDLFIDLHDLHQLHGLKYLNTLNEACNAWLLLFSWLVWQACMHDLCDLHDLHNMCDLHYLHDLQDLHDLHDLHGLHDLHYLQDLHNKKRPKSMWTKLAKTAFISQLLSLKSKK